MRLKEKNGQYYVDQIGLDQPLIFPGTMDKQTVARAVMDRYGDQVKQHDMQIKMSGGKPPPEKAFMLGAGQTGEMFSDFLNKPRFNIGREGITAPTPEQLAPYEERAQDRSRISSEMSQYSPTAFSAGAMTPYFAAPVGAVTRPAEALMSKLGVESIPGMSKAPEMVGRSIVADTASQGALFGAASDDSTAAEGAAYGAGGGVLGKALSRALKPADTVLDPQTRRLLDRGEDLGYTITPAQRTGSRNLAMVEDSMENNLLMSGGLEKVREANQANSNRIVREALGFKGPFPDRVTPQMLDEVSDRFNQRFKALTSDQSIKLDTPELLDTLARLEADNTDYVIYNKDFAGVIDRTLDLMAKNDGWLSGKDYQVLSSKLVKGIRSSFKPGGNPEFGIQLSNLKDAIDDAAEMSLGARSLDDFRSVRSDYKTYANLMKNSVINEDTGDVSLRQLGNVLRREDKYGYRRGKNTSDLYDATRFTRATQGDGVNSLTARRQSLPQTVIASSLLGAAAGSGDGGDPIAGVAAAAGLPISMLLMGKYYNSPAGRRHFGKGLLGPISDDFRRYLGQKVGAGMTGAAAQGLLP